MANYRLSKLADRDLGNIASYTIQRFGIRQANLYRDGLFKALEMISDFHLLAAIKIKSKRISVGMCMNPTRFTIMSMQMRFSF